MAIPPQPDTNPLDAHTAPIPRVDIRWTRRELASFARLMWWCLVVRILVRGAAYS